MTTIDSSARPATDAGITSPNSTNPATDQTAFDPAIRPPGAEHIDLDSDEYRNGAGKRYDEIRARCPVTRAVISRERSGDQEGFVFPPIWMVTSHEEGAEALLSRSITVDQRSLMTPEQLAAFSETDAAFNPLHRTILNADPPEHTRLRKLVQPSFIATAIERLRPRIQQIVDELLDAAEATAEDRAEQAPDRAMELISHFSYPLPVTVICEMLGIPAEDREQTLIWSDQILQAESPESMARLQETLHEFDAYLRGLFSRKREAPSDDLISQLLRIEVEGDRLTEDEIVSMIVVLFVAGHFTTVSLIANGIFALLTNPRQLATLRADLSLVPNAVEEILRYYGPVESSMVRFVLEDVALGGQSLAKGDGLLVFLAAANRDPARFSDPQTFDITRTDANRHIAFGKGVHACLGAPLVRLEGQIAIETLIRRYPELRLAVPADKIAWAPSLHRSLKELPLFF